MLVSCSSDDGMINSDNGIDLSEGKKENGDATIFVNFTLQDESGIEKYVFKEGENIIFKLAITNNTEKEVPLLNESDMLTYSDLFQVYSSKEEVFGQPFDLLVLTAIGGPLFLPSKSTYTFLCPWINNPDTEITWGQPYDNVIINKFRPLPKGEYYSRFTIRLNENRKATCKQSFIIE